MSLDESNGSDLSDEQMDALISGDSSPKGIQDAPVDAPAAPAPQEYTLKVNGQDIKAPLEKVLQWAQMGYNYPQRANELKLKQDEWQKQVQEKEKYWNEMSQKWQPYKEVDEFVAKNPDWWTQVQEQYKQKIQGAETNPEIAALKQELADLRKFRDDLKAEKSAEQIAKEDKQLSDEVESIRKSFPNIDFTTPDGEGKTLEMKILEHAQSMGLDGAKPGQFRAAFRDFYHDHLLGKAEEKGKEKVAKDIQVKTKLGILGESSKPSPKGFQVATNVKSKSYNDLVSEALRELEQGA